MLFASEASGVSIWFWIILIVVCLGVKRGVDNAKKFYCGVGRAVYNSPVASAVARHATASYLHRLFR